MKISLQNLLTKRKNEWLKEQWEKCEELQRKKIFYNNIDKKEHNN